ncbi:MAG: hypothetical protein K0S92_1122 [Desertimonas sp.]|nr:hypothetical protein [Desertimonas sp.]
MLPVVPLIAGATAVAVAVRSDDTEPEAIELTSSAADFTTDDELVAGSDLVVAATVVDIAGGRQISAQDNPAAAVRTRLLVLEVTDVLAGSVSGDVIVEEPATLSDGTPVEVDGMRPLDTGDKALWFLVVGDSEAMPYFAVVNKQGRYVVDGDGLRASSDDPLSTELAGLGLAGLTDRVEELVED